MLVELFDEFNFPKDCFMTEAASLDDKKISNVLENYIEIIYEEEMHEGAVRASTIAEKAKVSRSTVTSALKTLSTLGLVKYSPYSLIRLTDEGKKIGKDLSHRHEIFKDFFQNILQLSDADSDFVACELEHVVPLEATRKLGQFLVFLKNRSEIIDTWQDEYKELRKQVLKDAVKSEHEKQKIESKKNRADSIHTIEKYL